MIEAFNECDNPSRDNFIDAIINIKVFTTKTKPNNLMHDALTHSDPKEVGEDVNENVCIDVTKDVSEDVSREKTNNFFPVEMSMIISIKMSTKK